MSTIFCCLVFQQNITGDQEIERPKAIKNNEWSKKNVATTTRLRWRYVHNSVFSACFSALNFQDLECGTPYSDPMSRVRDLPRRFSYHGHDDQTSVTSALLSQSYCDFGFPSIFTCVYFLYFMYFPSGRTKSLVTGGNFEGWNICCGKFGEQKSMIFMPFQRLKKIPVFSRVFPIFLGSFCAFYALQRAKLSPRFER